MPAFLPRAAAMRFSEAALRGLPVASTQGASGAGTRRPGEEKEANATQGRRKRRRTGTDSKTRGGPRQRDTPQRAQTDLKWHLIAARTSSHTDSHTHTRTTRVRYRSRTLIFYTPTHSMVKIWTGLRVPATFTNCTLVQTQSPCRTVKGR